MAERKITYESHDGHNFIIIAVSSPSPLVSYCRFRQACKVVGHILRAIKNTQKTVPSLLATVYQHILSIKELNSPIYPHTHISHTSEVIHFLQRGLSQPQCRGPAYERAHLIYILQASCITSTFRVFKGFMTPRVMTWLTHHRVQRNGSQVESNVMHKF